MSDKPKEFTIMSTSDPEHRTMCTAEATGMFQERTYTAEELRLNQAALLREAAKAIDNIYPDRTRGAADGMLQKCMEVVLAIRTDQPALDRLIEKHKAETAEMLEKAAQVSHSEAFNFLGMMKTQRTYSWHEIEDALTEGSKAIRALIPTDPAETAN